MNEYDDKEEYQEFDEYDPKICGGDTFYEILSGLFFVIIIVVCVWIFI